jgi:hypothetical protein
MTVAPSGLAILPNNPARPDVRATTTPILTAAANTILTIKRIIARLFLAA